VRVRNVCHLIGPFTTDYRPFSYIGTPTASRGKPEPEPVCHGAWSTLSFEHRSSRCGGEPSKASTRKRGMLGVSSIANATLGTSRMVVHSRPPRLDALENRLSV
jgi:hypothetical protein